MGTFALEQEYEAGASAKISWLGITLIEQRNNRRAATRSGVVPAIYLSGRRQYPTAPSPRLGYE